MDETSILSGIWATLVDMASGKRSEQLGWLVPPLCLTAALAGVYLSRLPEATGLRLDRPARLAWRVIAG